MPYTQPDGSPYASGPHGETSLSAAKHADSTREHKGRQYLKLLYLKGAMLDHAAAAAYQWPLSSVCSIRNGLMKLGLVECSGEKQASPYGQQAWTWRLTAAGRVAVLAMLPLLEERPATTSGHDLNVAPKGRLL